MSGQKRRGRKEEHEEHENHERWLVTYADMLTLLMVLFIVMFAMSQVDQVKYHALKNGLADGFGSDASILDGSDKILDNKMAEINPTTTKIMEDLSPKEQQAVAAVLEQSKAESNMDKAKAEYSRLDKIRKQIEGALARRGLADDVRTAIDERGLVVSLVSKHVVFRADHAELSPRGKRVVDTMAPVLRELTEQLRIDGHTNQVKVRPAFYETDWDLSGARAVTVLRRLNEVNHVPGRRLSASAFGHEKPLIDPDVSGSQGVNKRVDIVILPDVPSQTLELLDDVAAAMKNNENNQQSLASQGGQS